MSEPIGAGVRHVEPSPPERSAPARAVLWDMDGTLVDTEPYWIEAEFEIAERHGARM